MCRNLAPTLTDLDDVLRELLVLELLLRSNHPHVLKSDPIAVAFKNLYAILQPFFLTAPVPDDSRTPTLPFGIATIGG